MKARLFASLILLLAPAAARADQAEHLTRSQAEKAVELLRTQEQVKHHCPACDDKGVYPEPVKKTSAAPSGRKDAWHVFIRDEGDALDLAYVYFKDKTGRWKNVALHLGLKVEGVPLFLPK